MEESLHELAAVEQEKFTKKCQRKKGEVHVSFMRGLVIQKSAMFLRLSKAVASQIRLHLRTMEEIR